MLNVRFLNATPTPVQRSGSALLLASCVFLSHHHHTPPWLTGILSSVQSFFPCPLILSLSLIPAQAELFVKTPPRDECFDTQRGIQLSANTIALITSVENANRWKTHAKMFSCQMWERHNKMWDLIISHGGSCLTPWPLLRAVTGAPSCIFRLYMGGQVFDKGEP